jgi:hypothetical protein
MKTHYKINLVPLGTLMAILAFMALSNWAHALSVAQCNAFASDGKIPICHATGSASHPFRNINVPPQACVNGHAGHADDYVAVNDPTCSGGSCLSQDAPCDTTLPCCDGLSCVKGTCRVPCVSDPHDICTAAVIIAGPCNSCCFGDPACGSSGYNGNACGIAGGFGCTNDDQNAACVASIIHAGCADECKVCTP